MDSFCANPIFTQAWMKQSMLNFLIVRFGHHKDQEEKEGRGEEEEEEEVGGEEEEPQNNGKSRKTRSKSDN